MPEKISKHSKSFAWLFSLALLGTVLALLIAWQFKYPGPRYSGRDGYQIFTYSPKAQTPNAEEPKISVDTSPWKEYADKKYGLKFKYAPTWKIRSIKNRDGYYVIEIDPGARYDNFRVYISKDDYFALAGVPVAKTQIAGKEALSLQGMVLGVKDNATYFTFDLGSSLSLKPYFQAMVDTVQFK